MARVLSLLIGCVAVVLAVGMTFIVAFAAVLWSAGAFDGLLGKGVGVASNQAANLPHVNDIQYRIDWLLDGSWIRVELSEAASDEDARRVWCQALIPADVQDGLVRRGDLHWPQPERCGDPTDVPRAEALGR